MKFFIHWLFGRGARGLRLCRRALARRDALGRRVTSADRQVAAAEAHRQRSVETDFDPHVGSAQTGANVGARNLIDLVVELDGVVVGSLAGSPRSSAKPPANESCPSGRCASSALAGTTASVWFHHGMNFVSR